MIHILNHGYLKLVEVWGSDERIIEAARMSTQKGFLGWGARCKKCKRPLGGNANCGTCPNEDCEDAGEEPGDEKLLKYLYTNKPQHSGPFEFAGLVIEVQAPIFVFREWHRHRTQSYNEMSARYAPLPDLNYIPSVERLLINSKKNKQAGTIDEAEELSPEVAEAFQAALGRHYADAEEIYQTYLKVGVPKELARVHLPVGRYSRMRATANLRNWLLFLTLRMDKNAQWEIRMYANALGAIIEEKFPRTWALFAEGRS